MKLSNSKLFSLKTLSLATAVSAAVLSLGAQAAPGGLGAAVFKKLSTLDVMAGNGSGVAEITDASADGKQLVYTDSPNEEIGFVDISNPAQPKADGVVAVGGEPTSVIVAGKYALVGVNTSPSYVAPSGKLVVVNRFSRKIVAEYELGGQPDSLALAPNGLRAAIVLENERDEDLNDGLLPQLPTGTLLIVDMQGNPGKWKIREADLSPVAASAPNGDDLEPEFVDINKQNEAVVTFQENNYLAVIDMVSGQTISHFSAGSTTINNVDSAEEDLINFDSTLVKRREPDSVTWISNDVFATANEGDYEDENEMEGGSRSFTLFHQNGEVQFESGESFEHWLASAGHYNEGRSENKGCEPEGIESGKFGSRSLLFVGSERCNAVGVYDVSSGYPEPLQILPTGIGPEGLKAIGPKKLFLASTETDVADAGIPTMINLFRAGSGEPAYPMIESVTVGDAPIPWVALSGMVGDSSDPDTVYAVSDSFLAEGFIYTIDVSGKPAKIVDRLQVTDASVSLDLEGIAQGPDGAFWLGSEGNAGSRPNMVLKVGTDGVVQQEIPLPALLEDERRSNGIEGIAVTGAAGAEVIYIAIQRAWPDEGDTDTVNTKIGRYEVATGEWTFVHYPLEAEGNGGWIGLSELTLLPDGSFAVVERDKGWGSSTPPNAELKAIYGIDLATAPFAPYVDGAPLPATIGKTLLRDVLPDLEAASIWTAEKLEGMAVTSDGRFFISTDNDGVDDATGETLFLDLGNWEQALGE
ncbi:esterase-like activity of phytase family protein [Haliea sp. E17]|uniref:esterase-like activity of phytase family protein n=1 Tax=Haliea sp. E17 TaxID=3401576 RepID=UPI003AAB76BE